MGTVKENLETWTEYNWYDGGDEWSDEWGSSHQLWYSSILPRIAGYLPFGNILEIAPGFGRCTEFLQSLCKEMWVVDVTPRCLDACRERFKDKTHIHYHHNDGLSLSMLPDNTFDFVFSWDSLVHCDDDVIGSYLHQLKNKMKPKAVGFFHHSNMGAFTTSSQNNAKGWRSTKVSAGVFSKICADASLKCTSQELIPWSSGDLHTDCLSTFTHSDNAHAPQNVVVENPNFTKEMAIAQKIDATYNFSSRKRKEDYVKTPLPEEYFKEIMSRKLVGWGSGEYFRESIKQYPFNLSYLVDMDTTKIGTTAQGLNIMSPERIFEENPDETFIAVFSPKYHRNIYQWLESHGFSYQKHFYFFDSSELNQLRDAGTI